MSGYNSISYSNDENIENFGKVQFLWHFKSDFKFSIIPSYGTIKNYPK